MAVMTRVERQREYLPRELSEQDIDVYRMTEAFRSIAVAWDSIIAGAWNPAAIQSFAALARRVALDLSTMGCGALDSAVVDLVLALDTITVSGVVSEQQLMRVDYALAMIRSVAMQNLMAMDLQAPNLHSELAPVLLHEHCPRCASSGVCAIMRKNERQVLMS